MDRVGAAVVGHLHDALQLQVGLRRRGAAEVMCLVRVADMDGAAVRVGVNSHGCNPELAARAHDANRDLAPVGDQHLAEEFFLHAMASRGWLGETTSPSLT